MKVSILIGHPDAGAFGLGGIKEGRAGGIQLTNQLRPIAPIRAKALGVVIKMRQINEGQVRDLFPHDLGGAAGDPFCGRQPGQA